ncbi:lysophospholipid acyltransferase family protein [Schaalia vaccimaxillae]|uniref:lysophospholipid acyltransferase family protein n=1 Tax=Schaalia vaccimaxillae TaxID=183916 RepID=UPI0003B605E3|nr:lysophospholipid acyltransferase family protein [Schaalia vaccimaxillae]
MSRVIGFYRFAKAVLTPLMGPWIKFEATGTENLPSEGGYLLVANHLSNIDPVCSCWFFMKRDVAVRYMAKKSMFSVPFFGWIFKGMGLIPVDRTVEPSAVLAPTRQALLGGEVVGIYPEGTLTRDPQMWPMAFKSGAARLALDTGVPVIPLSQWGAQKVLRPYKFGIDLRPRRPIHYRFGTPIDLSDLMSERGSQDHEAVAEATRRMEQAVVAGLEEIRGEQGPEQLWDPKA